MSIVKEFYRTREDGVNLFRTYSDENKIIIEETTGDEYEEAIDVENVNRTYFETDEYIEINTSSMYLKELEEKAKAYDIMIGEVE